jgi:dTDP-4-dehydrorhamnose reductase
MKKILLFGGTGGIGSKLQEHLSKNYECVSIGSKKCDVTDEASVKKFLESIDFDIIIFF